MRFIHSFMHESGDRIVSQQVRFGSIVTSRPRSCRLPATPGFHGLPWRGSKSLQRGPRLVCPLEAVHFWFDDQWLKLSPLKSVLTDGSEPNASGTVASAQR